MKTNHIWLLVLDGRIDVYQPGYVGKIEFLHSDGLYDALTQAIRLCNPTPKAKFSLGLPSNYFFFIDRDNDLISDSEFDSEQEYCYELETQLPISAEQMILAADRISLSIVLNLQRIQSLAQQFNDDEILFQRIVPAKILLAVAARTDASPNSQFTICVDDFHSRDILDFDTRTITGWNYAPEFSLETRNAKVDCLIDATAELPTNEFTTPTVHAQSRLPGWLINRDILKKIEPYDFAAAVNQKLNLTLPQTSIVQYAALFSSIALVLLAIGFFFRAQTIRNQTVQLDRQTRADFRQSFPGKRINAPLRRLLSAELEQIQNTSELIVYTNSNAETLTCFQKLLDSFPESVKCQIETFEILENRIELTGNVKTLDDLTSLRKSFESAGFRIGVDSRYSATGFMLELQYSSTTDRQTVAK